MACYSKMAFCIKMFTKSISTPNVQRTFDELEKLQQPGEDKDSDMKSSSALFAKGKNGHFMKGDAVVVVRVELKNIMGRAEKVDEENVYMKPELRDLPSNMVSPFSIRLQQLSLLAQQQSLLAAATNPKGGVNFSTNAFQTGSSDVHKDSGTGSWPNSNVHVTGMVRPIPVLVQLQKSVQVGNFGPVHSQSYGSGFLPTRVPTSSINGLPAVGLAKPSGATSISSLPSSAPRSGNGYDFSFLTQGFFSKNQTSGVDRA